MRHSELTDSRDAVDIQSPVVHVSEQVDIDDNLGRGREKEREDKNVKLRRYLSL